MFFDRTTPPPPTEAEDVRQPWNGPPEDALPAPVPWAFPLAVTPRVALALSGFRVWPTGFTFDLDVVLRVGDRRGGLGRLLFHSMHGDDDDDVFLRLGVAFADGRKAVEPDWSSRPPEEGSVVLQPMGGGGGPRAARRTYWVWPLPPAGPLTFACAWPRYEVPETLVETDAGELTAAAVHSRPLWTD